MMTANSAAKAAKALGNNLRAFLMVADVLEEIGNLENAVIEYNKRADKAREDVRKELAKRDELVRGRKEVEAEHEKAMVEARKVLRNAKAQADKIQEEMDNYKHDVLLSIEDAKAQADKELIKYKEMVNRILKDIDTKKAEYDEIIKKVEAVKAEARKLFGSE